MADDELEYLAGNAGGLTPLAREALRNEIERRKLSIPLQDATEPEKATEWRRPVTVRAFRDLPEAQLAKTILDSANIACFLADENLVRMDWFYSNAIGGIKLWVNEEDLEAAKALLDAEIPAEFEVAGVGEFKQPRCPKCESLDISLEDLNKPASYAPFIIGIAVPIKRSRWKCGACGNEWRDASS